MKTSKVNLNKPRSKPPRIITDTRIFDFEEDLQSKHFGILDKASKMLCKLPFGYSLFHGYKLLLIVVIEILKSQSVDSGYKFI